MLVLRIPGLSDYLGKRRAWSVELDINSFTLEVLASMRAMGNHLENDLCRRIFGLDTSRSLSVHE